MDLKETARLLFVIAKASPSQKIDEKDPEEMALVWQAILQDIKIDDAMKAVPQIARRQPYIAASDICEEVSRIRRSRQSAAQAADALVPNVDPDDPRAFAVERRAIMQAAADGTLDVDAYARGGITLTGAPPERPAALVSRHGLVGQIDAIATRKSVHHGLAQGRPSS